MATAVNGSTGAGYPYPNTLTMEAWISGSGSDYHDISWKVTATGGASGYWQQYFNALAAYNDGSEHLVWGSGASGQAWAGAELASGSFRISHTDEKTISIKVGGGYNASANYSEGSATLTLPALYTDPSTPSVSVKSKTHNSATFTVSISSYGNPGGASGRYIEAAILGTNDYGASPRRWQHAYNVSSADITVNNSSNTGSPALTIQGNKQYWYGGYATNTQRTASTVKGAFYLPPPPLAALSLKSQSYTAYNKVAAIFAFTRQTDGGDQTRGGYYRYSTDKKATWSNWVSYGVVSDMSGTFTIPDLPTGKTIYVQARLATGGGGYGEAIETSFSTKTTHTAPNFSDFAYEDTSTAAIALTNNNQIFIQGQSQPKVTISAANKATANDGASITSYTASLNAESIQIAYSASAAVSGSFNANRPEASGTLALMVAANDSLSLAKSVSKNVMVIPWAAPVLEATATRANNFENNTTIKIKGTYSPIKVNGVVKNTLAIAYRFKKKYATSWEDWKSVTPTINEEKYSVADFVLGFDNEEAWDIEVRAVDKFTTTTVAIDLSVGKPIFFISKNKKVSINRKPTNYNADLDVEGKVCAEDKVLS